MASICSAPSTGRWAERPLGSPTRAVKSPMISTTCGRRPETRAACCSTTVWPRWMSGAVGSIPSLTRSGRPSASCSASAPSGSTSTAFAARRSACARGSAMGPMLELPPRLGGAMLDCPTGLAATVYAALERGVAVTLARRRQRRHRPQTSARADGTRAQSRDRGAQGARRRQRRLPVRVEPIPASPRPPSSSSTSPGLAGADATTPARARRRTPRRRRHRPRPRGDQPPRSAARDLAAPASTARSRRPAPRTAAGATARGNGKPPADILPPAPPALPDGRGKPRLKKLRMLFVLAGLAAAGPGLDRLRDDDGGQPGPAGDLQLRPVPGPKNTRRRRRHRASRSAP